MRQDTSPTRYATVGAGEPRNCSVRLNPGWIAIERLGSKMRDLLPEHLEVPRTNPCSRPVKSAHLTMATFPMEVSRGSGRG